MDEPSLPAGRSIADLLKRVSQADSDSEEELTELLYRELRRLARLSMRRERPEHTLQPTALANEAYMRMIDGRSVEWRGRAHFLAVAARTMRTILIDHARRKGAKKRGGDRVRVPLAGALEEFGRSEIDALELEAALQELLKLDARKVQVVEMRFFSGMTAKEIAEVLDRSADTVQEDWYAARAWLRVRLRDSGG